MSSLLSYVIAFTISMSSLLPISNDKGYFVKDNIIINAEQGYYFEIPYGFTLNDEFYPSNLRLESQDTVIEIYQEDLWGEAQKSYVNYNNLAITDNPTDYSNISQFSGGNFSVISWNRQKLSKIYNDKNYYMKIDIFSENSVYTIFIKSVNPIQNYKTYMNLFLSGEKIFSMPREYEKKKPSNRVFNEETKKLYDEVFKKEDNLSWGIFHPEYMTNDTLSYLENAIGKKFDFALWYVGITENYYPESIEGFLNKTYSEGKITEMTLQTQIPDVPGNDLYNVLNGKYDYFLDCFAKSISDFDHPVLFRFGNEMNGDWCEYSGYQMSLDTELYRELYRYVYSFFEKHNADNVIWVWNPNGKSFPDYKWNSEDMYYPGDKYVDVYGLTLYNTGNYYPGENWTEFSELYMPLYNSAIKKYDMPFMITEFACARAGGNKEEWTKRMLSEIEYFDRIKLAVWWNNADFDSYGNVARAYYINDSNEMVEIFKNYFSNKK